jgi:serine/threonine protein kinase
MTSFEEYFHLTKLQNFLKFSKPFQKNHFVILKNLYNEKSLVQLVRYVFDQKEYVMKSFNLLQLTNLQIKNIKREIEIVLHLKHQNVLETYGYFLDNSHIYSIQEYATMGTLYNVKTDESELKKLVIQFLRGLRYIHTNHVIHRDIKPENTFLFTDGRIKIGDFDHSINYKSEIAQSLVGTLDYISPETLSNIPNNPYAYEKITYSTDIWALGILIYELFNGETPFFSIDPQKTQENIIFCGYEELNCSDRMKDFMNICLQKNSKHRWSADELLSHAWIGNTLKVEVLPEIQTYFIKKQMNFYKIKTRKQILLLPPKVIFISGSEVMTNIFYSYIEPKGYSRSKVEEATIIVIDYNLFNKNEKWDKYNAFKIALVTIHPDTATELLSDDFDAYMAKPLTKEEVDSIFPPRMKKIRSRSF